MYLHVGAEIATVIEVLATLGTGGCELSGALVDWAVVLVVTELTELFATLQTVEGFLPSVRAHMNLLIANSNVNN